MHHDLQIIIDFRHPKHIIKIMLVLYLVVVTVDYISNYDVTSVLEEKTIWATQGESQNNIDRN